MIKRVVDFFGDEEHARQADHVGEERDLDGHWTLDVSGSYGLNVAGFDRYKDWMAKGLERVRDLGPVLSRWAVRQVSSRSSTTNLSRRSRRS